MSNFKYDLKFGLLKWYKNIPIIVLAIIHVFVLNKQTEIFYLPDEFAGNLTFWDYLSSYNFGSLVYFDTDKSFELPALWFARNIYIVFSILIFMSGALKKVDKLMLIKSRKREFWWCSKCIYAFISIVTFFLLEILVFALFSIGENSGYSAEILSDVMLVPTPILGEQQLLFYAIILPFFIILSRVYLYMTVMLLNKKIAILSLIIEFGISAFLSNSILTLNGTMLLRTKFFMPDGISFWFGIIHSTVIIIASIIVGKIIFEKKDII